MSLAGVEVFAAGGRRKVAAAGSVQGIMSRTIRRHFIAAWIHCVAVVSGGGGANGAHPPMSARVAIQEEAREVDAGQAWTKRVTVPPLSSGERAILVLRARTDSLAKGGGGCNFVMQIQIDGLPLVESRLRPRLINKPSWFDPPGTKYHFAWFGPTQQAWTTVFCRDFEGNWAGSGADYDFVFDLTGLVAGGESIPVTFRHAMPGLPAAVKRDRAPLVIDRVFLGVTTAAEVERLRTEAQQGVDLRDAPVQASLPAGSNPGDRAYEIEWSGRKETPPAQVAFDNLAGWKLAVQGDAAVSLAASVDHLLWRGQTGKLSFGGGSRETVAVLRPPAPVTIPAAFDGANLWVYGAVDRIKDRRLRFLAVLEDADGREFQIDLGPLTSCYWNLLHGVLDSRTGSGLRWPAKFEALVIENLQVPEAMRSVSLESLSFYQQNRQPFARLDPPQIPVPEVGMLPTPPDGAQVTVAAVAGGAEFCSQAPGGTLRFRVKPALGCFHGITAQWQGEPEFHPAAGGSVRWDTGADAASQGPELLASASLHGATLSACWRQGPREWQADYRLMGRTLVVDVRCEEADACGLDFGQLCGLPKPRGIEVPYLVMGRKPGPWIACAGGLFVSVLPDAWHSDFSSVDTGVSEPAGDRIGLLKGTVYTPLTSGRRNPLRERVMITVSPEFAETLPNVRNPPSPNRERLAPYLFFMGAASSQTFFRTLQRYGIDHVIASDFAKVLVDDYAEGFGMRWRPHPALSLQQVQDWRHGIRSRGFLFGFYLDATDFWPGNEWFDENKLCLTPEGDFREAWYGNFATKFNAMPELVRRTGEKVQANYPADCVYLDVHTNRGLEAMDYEAGVEGAGMARALVAGNRDSILEARRWYGSTISEGICRWLYAGASDMDYATLITTGNPSELPPLVDFDLLKIHPFEHGTMMGYGLSAYFGQNTRTGLHGDGGKGAAPEDFYRYVSASLAYGHMLLLGYGYAPSLSRFIQYYALMQGAQQEYLTDTAAAIEYHNGSGFVPTSRALVEDCQKLGRLRVRYSRGLTVQVNCHAREPWTVEWGGNRYELPPFGWLAGKADEILMFSALRGEKRVDFVRCPEYVYLHSGAGLAREGPLEVEGAAWLKREGAEWRLIPCGYLGPWKPVAVPAGTKFCTDSELAGPPADRGCKRLLLDTQGLLGKAGTQVAVRARAAEGAEVPAKTAVAGDGRLQFWPDAAVVDYRLR